MGVKVALFAWGFKTEKVENLEKEKKYCVRTWKDSKVRNLGVILLEHKKGPGINYSECCNPSVQRKKQL